MSEVIREEFYRLLYIHLEKLNFQFWREENTVKGRRPTTDLHLIPSFGDHKAGQQNSRERQQKQAYLLLFNKYVPCGYGPIAQSSLWPHGL